MADLSNGDVLPPLDIKCTSSDCESNLHCFRETKKMSSAERGKCRFCGADLVDWDRVREQNLQDVAFTFQTLKYEFVRHHFWHKDIDPRAINHARRKGKVGMREAAEIRIRKSVGQAQDQLFRDGTQTPWGDANMIYYAQHATASCCRTCIQLWHGIPTDRSLHDDEIAYLVELAMLFIMERLPDLAEQGVKVPFLRRTDSSSKGMVT